MNEGTFCLFLRHMAHFTPPPSPNTNRVFYQEEREEMNSCNKVLNCPTFQTFLDLRKRNFWHLHLHLELVATSLFNKDKLSMRAKQQTKKNRLGQTQIVLIHSSTLLFLHFVIPFFLIFIPSPLPPSLYFSPSLFLSFSFFFFSREIHLVN